MRKKRIQQLGNFVFIEKDSQGAVDVYEFDTPARAKRAYRATAGRYAEWKQ